MTKERLGASRAFFAAAKKAQDRALRGFGICAVRKYTLRVPSNPLRRASYPLLVLLRKTSRDRTQARRAPRGGKLNQENPKPCSA
jgi:hypothetical protein